MEYRAIFVWPWNENPRTTKRTEKERFDWFIERIQTREAFSWLNERSGEKKLHAQELSRNQSMLRLDVILQRDWPIKQCLLHISVFFGGKTKRPCFDLLIHWLIRQITSTYRNDFSRSYESRSILTAHEQGSPRNYRVPQRTTNILQGTEVTGLKWE